MSIDVSTIGKATTYLEKASELCDEEIKNKALTVISGIKNAKGEISGNEEKLAYLTNMSINWVTEITSLLFCEGKLTDELEAEFRSLPKVKETSEIARRFQESRQARINEINEAQATFSREQKGLDIFMAIANGMDKETAKKQMEEYEAQLTQAQQQAAK